MEPGYNYYVVQVDTAFVANDYCEHPFTEQEEDAYAFTNEQQARQCAFECNGIVLHKFVSQHELDSMDAFDAEEQFQFAQLCDELQAL